MVLPMTDRSLPFALAALALALAQPALAQQPPRDAEGSESASPDADASPAVGAAPAEAEAATTDDEPNDDGATDDGASDDEPTSAAPPRAVPAPPPTTSAQAAVADRVGPALALVRCQGARWSVGFALGDAQTIVASTDARSCRRDITVESLEGRSASARSVTRDGNVALLLLDEDIGLVALEARTTTPTLGEPVFALGVPRGASSPIVTGGAVAFADGEAFQSDVPHPAGSEGGPLVDRQGRVVAVLREGSERGVSASTPIGPVAERAGELTPATEDVRQIAYPGFGLSFGAVWDSGDRLLGAAGIFSIDILDRLIVGIELGGYRDTRDGMVAQRIRRRLLIGTVSVGYRVRVAFPGGSSGTLTPHLGFSFTHDQSEVRTTSVGLVDPTCDLRSDSCELSETRSTVETDEWRYRPSAGVRLGLGGLELGYEVYLDTSELGDTGHRLHVGFRF